MKNNWKTRPKNLDALLGALLVVTVVQYALLTGLVTPAHFIFQILQLFCYLLLTVAIFRGFIKRSRLAWLVSQIMLAALFSFSVLSTVISAVLSLQSQSILLLLGVALLTAISNGLLMGVLFSLPVCDYFRPMDGEKYGVQDLKK